MAKSLHRMCVLSGLAAAITLLVIKASCGCISGRDARIGEGKAVAGGLWAVVTGQVNASCGRAVPVAAGFAKAGLDSAGRTTPERWRILVGADDGVTEDCATGTYRAAGDVFTVAGVARDVSAIRVKLTHADTSRPFRLRCSTDAGLTWADC